MRDPIEIPYFGALSAADTRHLQAIDEPTDAELLMMALWSEKLLSEASEERCTQVVEQPRNILPFRLDTL